MGNIEVQSRLILVNDTMGIAFSWFVIYELNVMKMSDKLEFQLPMEYSSNDFLDDKQNVHFEFYFGVCYQILLITPFKTRDWVETFVGCDDFWVWQKWHFKNKVRLSQA